jgi:nucleoid-associated protein YgaU
VKRVPVVREDAPQDVAKEDGAKDTKEPDAEKEAMDETVRDAVDVSLPTEHIVQKGETLSVLARRYYGSTVHWVRLWQSNQDRMVSKDVLLPGTVLSIPPGGRLTDQEKQVIQELEADQR